MQASVALALGFQPVLYGAASPTDPLSLQMAAAARALQKAPSGAAREVAELFAAAPGVLQALPPGLRPAARVPVEVLVAGLGIACTAYLEGFSPVGALAAPLAAVAGLLQDFPLGAEFAAVAAQLAAPGAPALYAALSDLGAAASSALAENAGSRGEGPSASELAGAFGLWTVAYVNWAAAPVPPALPPAVTPPAPPVTPPAPPVTPPAPPVTPPAPPVTPPALPEGAISATAQAALSRLFSRIGSAWQNIVSFGVSQAAASSDWLVAQLPKAAAALAGDGAIGALQDLLRDLAAPLTGSYQPNSSIVDPELFEFAANIVGEALFSSIGLVAGAGEPGNPQYSDLFGYVGSVIGGSPQQAGEVSPGLAALGLALVAQGKAFQSGAAVPGATTAGAISALAFQVEGLAHSGAATQFAFLSQITGAIAAQLWFAADIAV